jgi:hypothetical protein
MCCLYVCYYYFQQSELGVRRPITAVYAFPAIISDSSLLPPGPPPPPSSLPLTPIAHICVYVCVYTCVFVYVCPLLLGE